MTDKPIQLVRGKGSPTEGACWASALALWTGEKTWTDRPTSSVARGDGAVRETGRWPVGMSTG